MLEKVSSVPTPTDNSGQKTPRSTTSRTSVSMALHLVSLLAAHGLIDLDLDNDRTWERFETAVKHTTEFFIHTGLIDDEKDSPDYVPGHFLSFRQDSK
jgi:hypothetical protein